MAHRVGPHIDPPLARIPAVLAGMQASVFQTVLRDPPRLAKVGVPDEDDQSAFVHGAAGLWGIAHSSLLTNLASPDPRIRNGSLGALVSDANLAAQIGIAGVCFHVGYHKGHATPADAIALVARKLGEAVSKLKPGARLLLENGSKARNWARQSPRSGTLRRRSARHPISWALFSIRATCTWRASTWPRKTRRIGWPLRSPKPASRIG